MFIGDYEGKIDAKGRMTIPAQFRKNCEVGESFVLKQNVYDRALDLFPQSVWLEELRQFQARLNIGNRTHNLLFREYCRATVELSLDASGRVLLPKSMREYAKVDKNIVVVGMGQKMVLWSVSEYNAVALSPEEFEEILTKTLGR